MSAEMGEFLDDPETPLDAMRRSLAEQARINRYLGGGMATWAHALPWLASCPSQPLCVLEIGCGGADVSRHIIDVARRQQRVIRVVGMDRNPRVLACARAWSRDYPEISLFHGDALTPPFAPGSFDLILLPTVLHHLTPEQAIIALQQAIRLCRGRVIAADLRSHRLAMVLFRALAAVTGLSPMSRHDGLQSIARAYTPDALAALARQASPNGWTLHRHPFFRMALVRDYR